MVTGNDIIRVMPDVKPGAWVRMTLDHFEGQSPSDQEIRAYVQPLLAELFRTIPLRSDPVDVVMNIRASDEVEQTNLDSVMHDMQQLAYLPNVHGVEVMPDACPAGVISVGGIVSSTDIHPGFHSADICCSVTSSVFDAEPRDVFEAMKEVTHFGPGGRDEHRMPEWLEQKFHSNAFLSDQGIIQAAHHHMGTQGDGNHFAFVGNSEATGSTHLVTHHGSRKPGAMLFKAGMRIAVAHTRKACPEVAKGASWMPFDSEEGQAYWEALQIIREWTKLNHLVLHNEVSKRLGVHIEDQFWNEHNFVFQDGDMFHHAKGATPMSSRLIPEGDDRRLIPLNMSEPVLVGQSNGKSDFAPHGAGRNFTRTHHRNKVLDGETMEEVLERETKGLEVHFHCGVPDVTELPSAYKNADRVVEDIEHFDLCDVVDRIQPFGSIMAGDWETNAPWRR